MSKVFTPKPGDKVRQCPPWVEGSWVNKYSIRPFCEIDRGVCLCDPEELLIAGCFWFRGGDTDAVEFFLFDAPAET